MGAVKRQLMEQQEKDNIELDIKYQEPLSPDEISFIHYAYANGYIGEEQMDDFIKNPAQARAYIGQCEAFEPDSEPEDYK